MEHLQTPRYVLQHQETWSKCHIPFGTPSDPEVCITASGGAGGSTLEVSLVVAMSGPRGSSLPLILHVDCSPEIRLVH